jgi:hypothetical protein
MPVSNLSNPTFVLAAATDSEKGLREEEPVESDFINASDEQCKEEVLEKQSKVAFIEQNIIPIALERSAREGTLLMRYFNERAFARLKP